MKNLLLAILIVTTCLGIASAQSGILDPTFGNGNPAGTDIFTSPGAGEFEMAIAFQPDGKILISNGGEEMGLGRLNPNGLLDSTFGIAGWVNVGLFNVGDIVVLDNGQILVAARPVNISFNNIFVWRYNSNGSLDSTFGIGGQSVDTTLGASEEHIALQSGLILFSGSLGVKRLLSNGLTDSTFGNEGYARNLPIVVTTMAVDTNGIVLGGINYQEGDLGLIKLTPGGEFDTTFGGHGIDTLPLGVNQLVFTENVKITSSEKIVFASDYAGSDGNNHVVCAQFNNDGSPDSSFGNNGIVKPDWGTTNGYEYFGGIATNANNQIFIVSSSFDSANIANNTDIATLLLDTDGSVDAGFGKPRLDFNQGYELARAVGVEPDGKLVINGSTTSYGGAEIVARYTIAPTGINELKNESLPLAFYPDPVQNNATLSFTLNEEDVVSARIYSMDGRLIKQLYEDTRMAAGTYNAKISLPDEASGVYQIVLSNSNATGHISFVKL